jgi:aminoglycoside phosphotransferase (APT) family kinase protein
VPQVALIGQGRIAEIYAWGKDHVLKLFREWCHPDWVDDEARIARAVHATGIRAPAVGQVVEVDGRRGIIFERVYGPSMMEQITTKPWTFVHAAPLLAELHVSMHACLAPELPSLRRRLADKIRAAEPLSPGLKEAALNALDRLPDDNVLCHGDFHPDNVLMSQSGPIIIDWPDATRGHPLADVARSQLLMQVGGLPPGTTRRWLIQSLRASFRTRYLRRYFQLRPASREQLAAWQLPVAAARLSEDIPEERERVLALVKAGLSQPSGQ